MALLGRTALLSAALWLAAMAAPAWAQDVTLAEQKIKAGMLYNFLKYTDWPTDAASQGPITICLLGGDPFDGNLAPLAGRSVNQRTIAIRELTSASDLGGCQLLVLHARQRQYWPDLRTTLGHSPILTVSDSKGFATDGGMIEFTHNGSRITVNMNLDAVHDAQLHVQGRLLGLVTLVRGN